MQTLTTAPTGPEIESGPWAKPLPAQPTVPTEALHSGAPDSTHYTAEASSCGFPPGQWPQRFETTTPDGWTCIYRKTGAVARPDELIAMIYTTAQGEMPIHILND
jgi:hypothetical protein